MFVFEISILLIFLYIVYFKYDWIQEMIRKYILPNENVMKIKETMQTLDKQRTDKLQQYTDTTEFNSELNDDDVSENEDMLSMYVKLINILCEYVKIPFEFIYQLFISYGTPLFYKIIDPFMKFANE